MADRHTTARDVKADMAASALRAMARLAENLLGRAVELAPVEEGTLRGSATIVFVVNGRVYASEGALLLAIADARRVARAGGPLNLDARVIFETVYAAAQHEGLDFHHPKGGEAKYLEKPLVERAPRYAKVLAAAIEQRY